MSATVTKIELFPYYRAFFSNDGTWDTLTNEAKMSQVFMLYRLLSIKHADMMQNFNKKHSLPVLNALQKQFSVNGKQPGWAYTKAGGKSVEADAIAKYPKNLVQDFMKFHELEPKSFEFLCSYALSEVIAELDEMTAVWNQTAKSTKSRKKK